MENRIIQCMKSLQAPNLKTIVLKKSDGYSDLSDDEKAFDMSEESEKKRLYR